MGLENLREMFLWEKLVVKKEKKKCTGGGRTVTVGQRR